MPVSKKQKADKGYSPEDNGRASRKSSDKKEKAKVKDETKKSEGKKESSPRLPVTEKVFQRDLQTALERSKQDGEGKDESSEESNEEEEEKVSSGPKYDVKRGNHTNKSDKIQLEKTYFRRISPINAVLRKILIKFLFN
ncbi:cilia- and flagella-associated protein 251-like isoform X1 [Centruroides sculpturatus]|uniref:cilia- and flagella-associated protein 251-like isoform X1 n=1 Tax=Centruroides sculpturatus TaxID=218467 RepID=UPI000C6E5CCE|nr:cilia- and flagella-associated protein 251-like isoform X1 [Centruroides sculpturatus]